jgi:thymidylate synthase ThyX
MLSHSLAEVRQIGEMMKEVAKAETPTLVKYADAVPYFVETTEEIALTPCPSPSGRGVGVREKAYQSKLSMFSAL